MSLVWREQLSVGNNVIDTDHRYLIDIINRVEQSLGAGDRRDLSVALDSLSKYTQEHFAREEKIAHVAGYEQVPDLSHSHEALIKQLDEIRRKSGTRGRNGRRKWQRNSPNYCGVG